METCKFILKFQGNLKEFSSEQELDSFLEKHYDILSSDRNLTDIEYSRVVEDSNNPTEAAYSKLLNLQEKGPEAQVKIKDSGEKEISNTASYTGVTKFANDLIKQGGKGVYFNEENYIKDRQEEIRALLVRKQSNNQKLITKFNELKSKKDGGVITEIQFRDQLDAEILTEIQQDIKNFRKLAKLGTNLHSMAEQYFNEKVNQGKEFKSKNFPVEQLTLSDKEKDSYLSYLNDLESYIKNIHGEGAIMLPEYKVYNDSPNGTKLVGVIDLLVVDSKGNLHIYDYKASYKASADWHSSKRWSYSLQLGLYKNMLINKGFRVNSLNILPLQMKDINYDDETIGKLVPEDVDPLDQSMSRTIIDLIEASVPKDRTSFYTSASEATEIMDPLKKAFGYDLKIKATTANIENIKKTVEDDPKIPGNIKFKFRTKIISCKPEDLDTTLEKLYKEDAEDATSDLNSFKEMFYKCVIGKDRFENYGGSTRADIGAKLSNAFSKYQNGNWSMVMDDPILDKLGLIMLINDTTKSIEFVSFTMNSIHATLDLPLGNSLLGSFVQDGHAATIGNILPATNGNIEVMKTLFYIQANAEKFEKGGSLEGHSLGRTIVYNHLNKEMYKNDSELMLYNFKQILSRLKIPNKLEKIPITDIYVSTTEEISSLLAEVTDYKLKDNITRYVVKLEEQENGRLAALIEIQRDIQDKLKVQQQLNTFDFAGPTSYKLLEGLIGRAIAHERGVRIRFEHDQAMWGVQSVMTSNPGSSESYNKRQFVEVTKSAMARIRAAQLNYNNEKTPVFDNFLKNQNKNIFISASLGENTDAYDNLYERDDKGKLTREMKFKNPYDPSAKLTDNERDFLKYLLLQINTKRYRVTGDSTEDAKNLQQNGRWFEVPLLRKSSITHLASGEYRKAVGNYIKNILTPESFFKEDADINTAKSDEMLEMTNAFELHRDPKAREEVIDREGITGFETDAEVLLDTFVFSYNRQKYYNETLPLLNGIRAAIAYEAFEINVSIANTMKDLKMYTKTAYYNEKLIDKNLQPLAKMTAPLMRITSAMNMIFSPVSGTVNLLQGIWGNLSRITAKAYGKDMFTYSEFAKAYQIVCVDAAKSVTGVTRLEALNKLYGLNSMDVNLLPEKMKNNRGGLLNFLSEKMYWTMYAPDYMNRMLLFSAQMIHDGCWDAHTMVDGQLVYDFKKDQRFTQFVNGNKNHPDYTKQMALYDAMRLDFNKEGENIEFNESNPVPFKQAYNLKQRENLKMFADGIHGYYDHESKIAANSTILGILFMQFKTWMTAKRDQWALKPGNEYARGKYVHVEINGEKQYIDKDGNITSQDTGRPFYDWKGEYMEGIWYSLSSIVAEWHKAHFSPKQLWESMNANETRVSNMKMMAFDLGLVMLAALAMGLIDWPTEEEDPEAYLTVRAISRSISDLNVFKNLYDVASVDATPFASFNYVGDVASSIGQVFMGDLHWKRGLIKNVGALRAFDWMFEFD